MESTRRNLERKGSRLGNLLHSTRISLTKAKNKPKNGTTGPGTHVMSVVVGPPLMELVANLMKERRDPTTTIGTMTRLRPHVLAC